MKLKDIVIINEAARFGTKEKKIVNANANKVRIGFEFEWHGTDYLLSLIKEKVKEIESSLSNEYYNMISHTLPKAMSFEKMVFEGNEVDLKEAESVYRDILKVVSTTAYKQLAKIIQHNTSTELPSEEIVSEILSSIKTGDIGEIKNTLYAQALYYTEYDKLPEDLGRYVFEVLYDLVMQQMRNSFDIDLAVEIFGRIPRKSEIVYKFYEETGIIGEVAKEAADIVEASTIPYKLPDALKKLRTGLNWIEKNGSTSEDTGLHINISIDNVRFNKSDLNKLKLVLMLPERYLRKIFPDRPMVSSNLNHVILTDHQWETILDAMDRRKLTTDVIENVLEQIVGFTKSFRINFEHLSDVSTNTNRIEFRFPGGKNYEKRYDEIVQFIYMMVYAVMMAYDEKAGRKEYLKELIRYIETLSSKQFGMSMGQLYKYYKQNGVLPDDG